MAKNLRGKSKPIDGNGVFVCPVCGSGNVETYEEDYKFAYGFGESRAELMARIPIRKCCECGFSFRDWVADDICHEAVCHHLGIMTPAQIRAMRDLYGLTQAEFSEITKLGEATLSRWERGVIIQNEAYDNYLYLLGYSENFDRVLKRNRQMKKEGSLPELSQVAPPPECILIRSVPSAFPRFKCAS